MKQRSTRIPLFAIVAVVALPATALAARPPAGLQVTTHTVPHGTLGNPQVPGWVVEHRVPPRGTLGNPQVRGLVVETLRRPDGSTYKAVRPRYLSDLGKAPRRGAVRPRYRSDNRPTTYQAASPVQKGLPGD
jgi:hypothetical protein